MRLSPDDIRGRKNPDHKIVCLTAYTAPIAKIVDAHCDVMLVGDSLGMVVYGMENTLGVTLEMMIAHGQAVMRQAQNSCVVVDMPYGTYEASPALALENARKIMDAVGCDAVKIEGGADMEGAIDALVRARIPVMAHIGLQPQSVVKEGGYKVKGKHEAEIENLIADAKAVERAGAFAVVIEGTIEHVAAQITSEIAIPTIGIGASRACDGQILVVDDMLGLSLGHKAKFVKSYTDLSATIDQAVETYAREVRAGIFPDAAFTYKGKAS